jgi:hypothetical protein
VGLLPTLDALEYSRHPLYVSSQRGKKCQTGALIGVDRAIP